MDSLQEKNAALKSITEKLDSIMAQLEEARKVNDANAANISVLTSMLNSVTAERDKALSDLARKAGENAVNRKFRFGGHSQKGTSVKPQPKGRDDDRDDFDGTQDPNQSAGTESAAGTSDT